MAADVHHLDDGGFVGEVHIGNTAASGGGVSGNIKIGVRVNITIIHRNKASTISPAKQQVRNNTQRYIKIAIFNGRCIRKLRKRLSLWGRDYLCGKRGLRIW